MTGKHSERQDCVQVGVTPQGTQDNFEQSLVKLKRCLSQRFLLSARLYLCWQFPFQLHLTLCAGAALSQRLS